MLADSGEDAIVFSDGDDYAATLEGQYLKLTGLRSGRYVLVHRANPGGDVRESNYENNVGEVTLNIPEHPGRSGVGPWHGVGVPGRTLSNG